LKKNEDEIDEDGIVGLEVYVAYARDRLRMDYDLNRPSSMALPSLRSAWFFRGGLRWVVWVLRGSEVLLVGRFWWLAEVRLILLHRLPSEESDMPCGLLVAQFGKGRRRGAELIECVMGIRRGFIKGSGTVANMV
jgi:hypothetical protein